jgi:DNA-binding PadR family transcriptional regulator
MPESGVPPGTLVMLVLRVLQHDSMYGYAMRSGLRRHRRRAAGRRGSLYPALQRILVRDGRRRSGARPSGRRVRFYNTPAGRKQLDSEMSDYERVNAAIRAVLRTA